MIYIRTVKHGRRGPVLARHGTATPTLSTRARGGAPPLSAAGRSRLAPCAVRAASRDPAPTGPHVRRGPPQGTEHDRK